MKNKQAVLKRARQTLDSYIELKRLEAEAGPLNVKALEAQAKWLWDNSFTALSEGDLEKHDSYADSALAATKKAEVAGWAAADAIKFVKEVSAYSEARKNDMAYHWYTNEGQEKADRETEARCSSAEAAWFEDAAYGRGE